MRKEGGCMFLLCCVCIIIIIYLKILAQQSYSVNLSVNKVYVCVCPGLLYCRTPNKKLKRKCLVRKQIGICRCCDKYNRGSN